MKFTLYSVFTNCLSLCIIEFYCLKCNRNVTTRVNDPHNPIFIIINLKWGRYTR